ncbi:MAG: hypothetical protein NTZ59_01530 [Bacteroidetes bacterium]|nr:hypothetical protein [Bacteroidota bacterium]
MLFKEAGAEMTIGFKKKFEKNAEYKKHYQIAITKYLDAYNLDSTIPELTIYLPNLYFDIQKFDSSLFWSYKLLREDSINYVQGGSNNYLYLLENLGNCYLLLGDLNKSTYYLKLNYKLGKKQFERTTRVSNNAIDTTNLLCRLALNIDKSQEYKQLRNILIQKKVKTCDYAIGLLKLFQELHYSKKKSNEFSLRQINIKIVQMKNNCK